MYLFISGPEILFIGLVVLLVFGADKIPEISKGLGKVLELSKKLLRRLKVK